MLYTLEKSSETKRDYSYLHIEEPNTVNRKRTIKIKGRVTISGKPKEN
ncbi:MULTISPECIES: hypothetical protein [Aestuariibaculum]|uniref:Uncharacterized protein n=1 Tax=Aestuariibaculum lutulentum TaxID=2920935 RepID=A0ABS9RLI3_9FLAO|nr:MULTISPECIES: hypothetical protein [Aestuariibaculum]MCH4552957.1 hypothetical protein [Aestuariibaculum lutulentum]MCR8669150.1 hypothetical protein [Aestuariibaculum sp. M13]